MSSSFRDHRLPRGRHNIPPEKVRESQRWRLLGACAEVLAERGYPRATVQAVVEASGVSRRDFYRSFSGLPDCILAVHAIAATSVLAIAEQGCRSEPAPAAALSTTVDSLWTFFHEERALAWVLTDPALVDLPAIVSARAALAKRFAAMLADLPVHPQSGAQLVGGCWSWVFSQLERSPRLTAQQAEELVALLIAVA